MGQCGGVGRVRASVPEEVCVGATVIGKERVWVDIMGEGVCRSA